MRNERSAIRRLFWTAGLAAGVAAASASAQSSNQNSQQNQNQQQSAQNQNRQQNQQARNQNQQNQRNQNRGTSQQQNERDRVYILESEQGWYDDNNRFDNRGWYPQQRDGGWYNRDDRRQFGQEEPGWFERNLGADARRDYSRRLGIQRDEMQTYYHLEPYDRPGYLGVYEEDVRWDQPVDRAGDAMSSPDWRYGYYDPQTRTGYPIYEWDEDEERWVMSDEYDGWLERGEWPDQRTGDRNWNQRRTDRQTGMWEDDPIFDDYGREAGDFFTQGEYRYGNQDRTAQRRQGGVWEDDPIFDDYGPDAGDFFTQGEYRYGNQDRNLDRRQTGRGYEVDTFRLSPQQRAQYDRDSAMRQQQAQNQWQRDRTRSQRFGTNQQDWQQDQYRQNQMRNQQQRQMEDQYRRDQMRMQQEMQWRQQQQRQGMQQRPWGTGEDQMFQRGGSGQGQLNGRILAIHSVELEDAQTDGNVVFIATQDGSGHLVNLGDKSKDDLKIQRGSTVQLRGELDQRTGILNAQTLRVDGQQVQVQTGDQQNRQQQQRDRNAERREQQTERQAEQREQQMERRQQQMERQREQQQQQQQQQQQGQSGQQASLSGQVSSAERASVSGAEGTVIRIQMQDGQTHFVDIGKELSLDNLKLEGEQRVSISGKRESMGGRTVIKADRIRVGDQTHNIKRDN